ncbi:uncharacterized protein [Haliotis asinina]|uniref:uncharacterized protein n=1 Tax=Haliotis asinina TaxID=109174 RepID=UPI00353269E2
MGEHSVIKTTRIHTSVTERALKLYFKKWQSEGYTVTDVYINKDEEAASVHFKECNLKPDLLKRPHKIGGVTFYTSLYPEWLKLPSPFSIHDLDPQKMRFLKTSERTLSDFERQLHDIYTTCEFDSEYSVILTCCLTKDVPNAEHRADTWEAEVRSLCEQFFSSLSTERVNIPPEIWNDVIRAIGDLQMPNRDEAVLHINPELNLLDVVGHKIITEPLMQVLTTIKEKTTNDYMYRTDQIMVVMTVRLWHLHLLKRVDFDRLMSRKYPHLKTELDLCKEAIIFSGVMFDIEPARKDLKDMMLATGQERLWVLSEEKFKLVQKRSVREYIEKKLENVKGSF